MAKKDILEEGSDVREFNSMAAYLKRIDRRSDERDTQFNEGDPESAARTTMTLLLNCIPRFRVKFDDDEDKKSKYLKIVDEIEKIWKAIESHTKNQELYKINRMSNLFKLYRQNIELETLKFDAGMIYPEREIRELAEIIEEDY